MAGEALAEKPRIWKPHVDANGISFTTYARSVFTEGERMSLLQIVYETKNRDGTKDCAAINRFAKAIYEGKTLSREISLEGKTDSEILKNERMLQKIAADAVGRRHARLRTGGRIIEHEVPLTPELAGKLGLDKEYLGMSGQKTVTIYCAGSPSSSETGTNYALLENPRRPRHYNIVFVDYSGREGAMSEAGAAAVGAFYEIAAKPHSKEILEIVSGIPGLGRNDRLALTKYLMGDPGTPMLVLQSHSEGKAARIAGALESLRENKELASSLGERGRRLLAQNNIELSGAAVYVGRGSVIERLNERAYAVARGEARPGKQLNYIEKLAIRSSIADLHPTRKQLDSLYAFYVDPRGAELDVDRVSRAYARLHPDVRLWEYKNEVLGALTYLGINPKPAGASASGEARPTLIALNALPGIGGVPEKTGPKLPLPRERYPSAYAEIASSFGENLRAKAVFSSLAKNNGSAAQVLNAGEAARAASALKALKIPGLEVASSIESEEDSLWRITISYVPQPLRQEGDIRTYANEEEARVAFNILSKENKKLRLEGNSVVG